MILAPYWYLDSISALILSTRSVSTNPRVKSVQSRQKEFGRDANV